MINSKPDLPALAGQISKRQLTASSQFLGSKRALAAGFQTVEDLAIHIAEHPDPKFNGFEHHFMQVRNAILRKLWAKGVWVGPSVIEELLFSAICDPAITDPVLAVFTQIKDFGLHRPGFVLYPLHSFGIMGAGLFGFLERKRLHFIDADAGIAITPQVNSEEELFKFLTLATEKLRMKKRLPKRALDHYLSSSVLKWLIHNPLLLVKCKTFTQQYFENQFLLTIKLKLATTLVTMLCGMQNATTASRIYSTSRINNFETLDIKHYVVFEAAARGRRRFNAQRVSMNLSAPELSEISELNVELNPLEWSRRSKLFRRIAAALVDVERGYLEKCIGAKVESVAARIYRKVFLALDYFRRSFHSTAKSEDGIVNLAVAFETLLTDHYAPGVGERIKERVRALLRGVTGCRKMVSAVEKLSQLRNESVHTGKASSQPEWQQCRLAFIHTFLGLAARFKKVGNLAPTTGVPMADLIAL